LKHVSTFCLAVIFAVYFIDVLKLTPIKIISFWSLGNIAGVVGNFTQSHQTILQDINLDLPSKDINSDLSTENAAEIAFCGLVINIVKTAYL